MFIKFVSDIQFRMLTVGFIKIICGQNVFINNLILKQQRGTYHCLKLSKHRRGVTGLFLKRKQWRGFLKIKTCKLINITRKDMLLEGITVFISNTSTTAVCFIKKMLNSLVHVKTQLMVKKSPNGYYSKAPFKIHYSGVRKSPPVCNSANSIYK